MAVPTDREADLSQELASVFAAIDAVDRRAQQIRDEAEARAAQRLTDAESEADRIRVSAREGAEEVRARAAARRREDITDEVRSAQEDARTRAEEIRRRADHNLDDLADRVVRRVLDGLRQSADPGAAADVSGVR